MLDRLDRASSGWGATKVTKSKVGVEAVSAGAEEDLRLRLGRRRPAGQRRLRASEADGGGDGPSEADSAMTEAFRSLADEPAAD